MAKRLTRAKRKIRATNIAFTVPAADHFADRLPAVLHVIYLIFTEGHASAEPPELVRGDLCDETVWLAGLVADLVPAEPEVHGLAALVLLTDARREARIDNEGRPVLLEDQDRSRWDRDKIENGLARLRLAHDAGPVGTYGLQAAVAAVHAIAGQFGETDWPAIVEIYDRIGALHGSPVVALNRAVAVSYTDGPAAALAEVDGLSSGAGMDDYHYFHATRAELLRRLGRFDDAVRAYERALTTCPNEAERRLLQTRLVDASAPPIAGSPPIG